MIKEPINLFTQWYENELKISNQKIPSACCLSTLGVDNYPNARFVSLKEVWKGNFIITGSLSSEKGIEISLNPKVALTFWWPFTERQIRIQGDVAKLSDSLANKYFASRNRESQIVSSISNQSETINNLDELVEKFYTFQQKFSNKAILRPKDWGALSIIPKKIEFMEFKSSRFHERKLFEKKNNQWTACLLQP